ncbi:ankyrin repeat domain-containing protein SOWAHB [Tiliqua scincoides]|uniref:ankyrin repeat domain-containing protein SOWAHB n=1 Tax=Tiliqua scincoides TaxID=71010 RepID=UPI0034625FB2
MARELSQAELLDFLCAAGGRVSNAALLGHFARLLRDPAAPPAELRRRRERFKGFVNAVATVRQDAPAAPKFVVLRRRFRELVGEDAAPGPPPEPRPRQQGAPRGGGRATCPADAPAGPRPSSCPPREPTWGLGAPPPARSCHARPSEACLPRDPRLPLWARAPPPSNGPCFLSRAPPSPHQRIHEWLEKAHPSLDPPAPLPDHGDQDPWPGQPPPPSSSWSTCLSPSLDSHLGRFPAQVSVFRSIRCQLSLQDLEDFVEQESPTSESSSGSGGSDSCRGPGAPHPISVLQHGPHGRNSVQGTWSRPEGTRHKPRANGQVVPPARKSVPHRNGAALECFVLLSQEARGSSSSEEQLDKDSRSQRRPLRKVARLPPPRMDAPLSPGPVPRQGHLATVPDVEGLGPEHRASSVPLESREHTWLVKVAMGSWLQVRALLHEDPHLATRKDFVSGYTVLHWLAKHGNAQVLLEVVTSVRKAGVALDVNAKSGCGYTPLHLAAIHGHQLVIKVLVQKLRCLIQVRDSSGKKPWQYLSSATSGEVWQLLGAPRDKTIFPARPITRTASASSNLARNGKSPQLARKISRKASLAAYLKPQHIKWKTANKYPPLQEKEEYSD